MYTGENGPHLALTDPELAPLTYRFFRKKDGENGRRKEKEGGREGRETKKREKEGGREGGRREGGERERGSREREKVEGRWMEDGEKGRRMEK